MRMVREMRLTPYKKIQTLDLPSQKTSNILYCDGLVVDLIKDDAAPGSGDEESWDLIGSDCRSRAMAIAPDTCDPKTHYVLGGSKTQCVCADSRGRHKTFSTAVS
jgi:hypothetical protein